MQQYRYNGRLTAEYEDADGVVEVVDEAGFRYLHFGSPSRQSGMSLSDPARLCTSYERSMAACLLFEPAPARVLMIGLGAGCFARFLLQACEHAQLQVVEKNPVVIDVAHRHFGLAADPRLQIITDCGARHVAARQDSCDLIVVDAYRADGIAPEVASEEFFRHCRRLLGDKGLLVINLWRNDKLHLSGITRLLVDIFDWRAHFIPVEGLANIIGYAFATGFPGFTQRQLETRARQLQHSLGLDFPGYLHELMLSDPMGRILTDD